MSGIKLYVSNELLRCCFDLFDAVEWAIAFALEGYAVKVVCNDETIIDWAEGFIQKAFDKENK